MWKVPDVLGVDPQIKQAIEQECQRQEEHIELIASENFVSEAVLAAMGSPLTNKYAEGYPHRRYYGGCEFVDVAEDLAIERAKQLFGADHANVQAHSGSQANMAAYFALLNPGDRVLGMSLNHGGHLTHGSPFNISGKYFEFASYGLDPQTETIDYDEVERLAHEYKPRMIVAGAVDEQPGRGPAISLRAQAGSRRTGYREAAQDKMLASSRRSRRGRMVAGTHLRPAGQVRTGSRWRRCNGPCYRHGAWMLQHPASLPVGRRGGTRRP